MVPEQLAADLAGTIARTGAARRPWCGSAGRRVRLYGSWPALAVKACWMTALSPLTLPVWGS